MTVFNRLPGKFVEMHVEEWDAEASILRGVVDGDKVRFPVEEGLLAASRSVIPGDPVPLRCLIAPMNLKSSARHLWAAGLDRRVSGVVDVSYQRPTIDRMAIDLLRSLTPKADAALTRYALHANTRQKTSLWRIPNEKGDSWGHTNLGLKMEGPDLVTDMMLGFNREVGIHTEANRAWVTVRHEIADIMMSALVGMPVRKVVDHPGLQSDELTITDVHFVLSLSFINLRPQPIDLRTELGLGTRLV